MYVDMKEKPLLSSRPTGTQVARIASYCLNFDHMALCSSVFSYYPDALLDTGQPKKVIPLPRARTARIETGKKEKRASSIKANRANRHGRVNGPNKTRFLGQIGRRDGTRRSYQETISDRLTATVLTSLNNHPISGRPRVTTPPLQLRRARGEDTTQHWCIGRYPT